MRILVDVDGVLANFIKGACELHGRLEINHNYNCDLPEALGIEKYHFYASMGEHFWSNLELMPDALDIMQLINDHFPRECTWLCTSPIRTYGCLEGKRIWMEENFNGYKWIIISDKNGAIEGRDTVLIDDRDEIIKRFKGKGILVPRAWNTLHYKNPLTHLQEELRPWRI